MSDELRETKIHSEIRERERERERETTATTSEKLFLVKFIASSDCLGYQWAFHCKYNNTQSFDIQMFIGKAIIIYRTNLQVSK